MTNKENMALLFKMIESLREAGNWTGETSIHKALYMLKKLMNVNINYNFTLYLHGPFSFELRDDLNNFVAYDLIKLEYESKNYGPKHKLSKAASDYIEEHPRIIDKYGKQIDKVCSLINSNSVVSLEKTATALYVIKELNISEEEAAIKKLMQLKPHINDEDAKEAVKEVNGWIEDLTKAS